MSFNLNKWLEETIDIDKILLLSDHIYQRVRPRFVCQDGFSVSIQASENHYCEPRYTQYRDGNTWHVINGDTWSSSSVPRKFDTDHFIPYESVELGYPSMEDELINSFAEDAEEGDYTSTIYGCVPVEVVEELIEKHGGFKEMYEV